MDEFYDDRSERDIKGIVSEYESLVEEGGDFYMSVPDLLDVAEYYVKAGRLSEADACLHTASRLYPDDEEVKLMSAYRLRDEGYWLQAIALVDSFQDKEQRDVKFFYIDAKVAMMDLKEAEKIFQTMVSDYRGPEYVEDILTFTEILVNYGFYQRAESWLSDAEPVVPMPSDNKADVSLMKRYWEMRGEVCFQLHRYAEAETYVNRLIDLEPYDEGAWTMLADIQFQDARYADASESVEYALSINPSSARALRMKLFIISEKADVTDVGVFSNTLELYLNQYPNDHAAYVVSADYLFKIGSMDVSYDLYAKAVRCCPSDSADRLSILEKLATVQLLRGDYSDALQTLQCGLSLNLDFFTPYHAVVNFCAEKGDKEVGLRFLVDYYYRYGIAPNYAPEFIRLLTALQVYEDAWPIWHRLSEMRESIPESHRAWLRYASQRLGLQED
ncbi:MAG: tetratricopeptide repeat protein [Alloprevotella sp.]|nr:tetratricopeptide repeat protein [Alloprevotella sp.]